MAGRVRNEFDDGPVVEDLARSGDDLVELSEVDGFWRSRTPSVGHGA